jgi:hypothetical protein
MVAAHRHIQGASPPTQAPRPGHRATLDGWDQQLRHVPMAFVCGGCHANDTPGSIRSGLPAAPYHPTVIAIQLILVAERDSLSADPLHQGRPVARRQRQLTPRGRLTAGQVGDIRWHVPMA